MSSFDYINLQEMSKNVRSDGMVKYKGYDLPNEQTLTDATLIPINSSRSSVIRAHRDIRVSSDIYNAYLVSLTKDDFNKAHKNRQYVLLFMVILTFLCQYGALIGLTFSKESRKDIKCLFSTHCGSKNQHLLSFTAANTLITFFIYNNCVQSSIIPCLIPYDTNNNNFGKIKWKVRIISYLRGILFILATLSSFLRLRNVDTVWETFTESLAIFFVLEADEWILNTLNNSIHIFNDDFWIVRIQINNDSNNSESNINNNIKWWDICDHLDKCFDKCYFNCIWYLWVYLPLRLPFETRRQLFEKDRSKGMIYIAIWHIIAVIYATVMSILLTDNMFWI